MHQRFRTRRHFRTSGLAALGVLVGTLIVPGASGLVVAHSAPTGNAATISYMSKVVNKVNALAASVAVVHNLYWFGYDPHGGWYLSWASPKPRYSYQHAVDDTEIATASKGKITWTVDTFATPCTSATTCKSKIPPLRIYASTKGDYWAVLNGPGQTLRCWNPASGVTSWITSDWTTGYQRTYLGAAPGDTTPFYKPLVTTSTGINVSSIYRVISTGRHVTEVDLTNSSTHLYIKSSWWFTKGNAKGELAFADSASYRVPKKAPGAPTIKLCH